ncbi:hypothetical protein D3C84_1180810 [compost metagenome]
MPATVSHHQTLTRLSQVANNFLGASINHRGADRHRQDQILTLGPGTFGAATLLAIARIEAARVAIVD